MTARDFSAKGRLLQANLTGIILDHGVDTDGNGLYDYLEIDVQVNVSVADTYTVNVYQLMDQNGSYLYDSNSTSRYLEVGDQYLALSLYGPAIFGQHLNPSMVYSIDLYDVYGYLDSIFNVNLSRTYSYSEFDPHAFLTGNVTDRGIDIDGNTLFDYLEVGVEVNVTLPGTYRLNVVGLMEKEGMITNYMYDYHSIEEAFAAGTQFVYMNFSGPGTVYYRMNPTDVYFLTLHEGEFGFQVEHVESEPLSMKYNYALFDVPSNDMQVNFSVYPNATVAVNGMANARHMFPPNTGSQINATVDFSSTGDLTTGLAEGTIVFPKSQYWSPYDTSQAHFNADYANGLFNAKLNATMILPEEATGMYPYNTSDVVLDATYSGGMLDLTINGQTAIPSYNTMFPFNISDAILLADYDGTQLTGNITFHSIGGFPLGDVKVNFAGDRNSLVFTGNANITYGSYEGFQINETILDQMISELTANFTGHGPSSLYNVTMGFLECTQLSTTKNPWSDPSLGADVVYDATVTGNLTGLIARLMFPQGSSGENMQQSMYAALESAVDSVGGGSILLNYYHTSGMATINAHLRSDVEALWNSVLLTVPDTLPVAQKAMIVAWLKIGNATAYALTDAVVNASYSSAEGKITLLATVAANATQLKEDVKTILPDAVPPEMHGLAESFFNTTYCTLDSSTSTFDLENGTGTFELAETLHGDFNAEVNYLKAIYIESLNASSPSMLPWQLRLLNATEIDVSDFHLGFRIGYDSNSISFDGFLLKPQPDVLDSVRFVLYNWFNSAEPFAPPLQDETLKITISGSSNATHTVLLYQPSSVPDPNSSALDYRSMAWNNASLSSLRSLMFLVAYEGKIDYNSKTYLVPVFTNSTVSNFGFNPAAKQIFFNVTGTGGTGFCNVTVPRNLLNATALEDWVITFDGTVLTSGQFDITQNAQFVFISLNYTHSEHLISIAGTMVIAEYQPNLTPLILIVSLIAAGIIAFTERKRLRLKATTFLHFLREVHMPKAGFSRSHPKPEP